MIKKSTFHDVAVKFDGPTHYYEDASGQRTTMRTNTTELRDMLLGKKCAKVVTVPYFEWHGLTTQEMRVAYVRQKLACSLSRFENDATDVPIVIGACSTAHRETWGEGGRRNLFK